MNAVKDNRKNEFISGNMGKPALYSVIFHVVVFILATVGLPYVVEDVEPMEMAITVELVDLSEVSQTNVLDKPQESEEKEAPAEQKPVYNNTDTVPDLLSPPPPEEVVEEIPEPPKEKPKPDLTQIKKPPKPKNKPRKPKPTPPKPEKPPEEDIEQDFTSLLKSLATDEPAEESTPEEPETNKGQTSQIADFSKQMTRNEFDDLNRGVEPCWNVNAGGKDAQTLIVQLSVFVNRDRTVRDVQIIDRLRYNTDTHFKAAADAARRALLNPRCSTLRLPLEKYERWKNFKYVFDPSKML